MVAGTNTTTATICVDSPYSVFHLHFIVTVNLFDQVTSICPSSYVPYHSQPLPLPIMLQWPVYSLCCRLGCKLQGTYPVLYAYSWFWRK